jgi:steroid delta-isomerase-like uncharacterized protein
MIGLFCTEVIMRDILNRLIATWNTHDLDQLVTYYADDYEGSDVGLAQNYHGLSGLREMATAYYTAFPDLAFTLTQTIVENNCAVLTWKSSGTHRGKIMNIPPTGRLISVSGITSLKIKNGQVWQSTVLWDVAGLLREIGLLPDL